MNVVFIALIVIRSAACKAFGRQPDALPHPRISSLDDCAAYTDSMHSPRKIALWAAIAISIPGAAFALIVAIPRIPIALMYGPDSFRIPTLYLIYLAGMMAGFLCVGALIGGLYQSGAKYGLRTILAALGTLAAAYLEYYFRNERFPLIPAGYLVFTSAIWVSVTLIAWRQSQETASR